MRKLVFLFILALTTGAYLFGQDIKFTASAPEAVVMGEQFRLSYSINSEAKDLRIPELTGFDILIGPSQSTSYKSEFVNGRASSETTVTFTYILMPKEEGTYNIAPATINAKNANYTSNALVIKVLPADQANNNTSGGQPQTSAAGISNDDVFLRMQVSRQTVYEQEALLVSFKLYSSPTISQIGSYKFPEFEGFLVQDIEMPSEIQVKVENYNNRNYQTYLLKQSLLFPQRSGKLSIEGARLDVAMQIPTQQRISSFFDDFFGSYRTVSRTLTSQPVTIDVKPLPSGKPASFSGGVGDFTMSTNINSTDIKANEAVTITVKLSGTGNIRLVRNPEVTFPNDFDIYDPKVDQNIRTTTSGVTGTKTIEYMAIPRFGGEFEIPAISFSYFDLKSNSYKTLSSESYKINVEQGTETGEGSGAVVSNFSNRENVRFLGQDIRFLKVNNVKFLSQDNLLYGSIAFYLWYLIPALLFVIFFIVYRKQVKENANIALVRTKKANKIAVKRLKNAGKLLKDNKEEAFYDEVLRALWGYLSDKLSIPQSTLTKDNVEIELEKFGVADELTKEFIEILNTCEFARYAPSKESGAMDKVYEQTVDAIGKMENTIAKKRTEKR